MPNKITIPEMISFLDASIKITEDHVRFYKKTNNDSDYIHTELAMLKAIKNAIKA